MLSEFQVALSLVGLTFVLIGAQGSVGAANLGVVYGLGSRDQDKERGVFLCRIDRTLANHMQGLTMFFGLLFAAMGLGVSGGNVALGATIFLVCRVAFSVLYLLGVPYVRTIVWTGSIAGLIVMSLPIISAAFG